MAVDDKKVWMQKYAELITRFGVNIQKGQNLVFILPHEAREFGLYIVEAAYKAGSGQVVVYYLEYDIYKIKQETALLSTLEQENKSVEQALGNLIDDSAAVLILVGAHSEAMSLIRVNIGAPSSSSLFRKQ